MKVLNKTTLFLLSLLVFLITICPTTILADNAIHSNLTGWQSKQGTWSITSDGKIQGTSNSDGFYMASEQHSNFVYEADINFVNAKDKAAALVFRSNEDGSKAYVANVDRSFGTARLFKFPAVGQFELGSSPIQSKSSYHLKVLVNGEHILFYLDDVLIIDAQDNTYTSGNLGLNVFSSNVVFDNVRITFVEDREPGKGGVRAPDYYSEQYRPQYHFTPEFGWLNDPNGMVYYEGEYHLFYQYYPYDRVWGPMHWGHAVSKDMIHWEHLPIALYPDKQGYIFSGSAVVDAHDTSGFFNGGSGLVAIFTHDANGKEKQSIAYSKDKGRTWTKYAGNPVLPPIADNDYRDPKVIWHEETQKWIMAVAGGKFRIYSSPNLINWTLESENNIYTECPDLFPLPVDGNAQNKKWVLSKGGRSYIIGSFDGKTFVPETNDIPMNYGPDTYATQSFSDVPGGRRIIMSWMTNLQYASSLKEVTNPWNGANTIPYELSLVTSPEGIRLMQKPIAELQQLRGADYTLTNKTVSPGTNLLEGHHALQAEIEAVFELGTAQEFGLKVRQGESEETIVGYDTANKKMFVDRNHSGAKLTGRSEAPLTPENNRITMHLFVDWSSVEAFGNDGKQIITNLVFPQFGSDKMELYAKGGDVQLVSLHLYDLKSTWRDDSQAASPAKVLLSESKVNLPLGKTTRLSAIPFPFNTQLAGGAWSLGDAAIAEVTTDGVGHALIKGLGEGTTSITFTSGQLTATAQIEVYKSEFNTNLTKLVPQGGTWIIRNGLEGNAAGDGFNIATEKSYKNFIYESDLTFKSGVAAALIFRSNDTGSQSYVANVDRNMRTARIFKFPANGNFELGTARIDVKDTYHLKVVANGKHLQYYLDGKLIIEADDATYQEGKSGFNVFSGDVQFNNSYLTDLDAPPKDLSGVISGPQSVQAGKPFTLNYGITGDTQSVYQSVYAQDVTFTYDPEQMEFISADSLLTDQKIVAISDVTKNPGKVRILSAMVGGDHSVNGEMLALHMRAKSSSPVTALISLSDAVVANGTGVEKNIAGTSYSVQITAITTPGDTNGDNKISIGDLAIVASYYGKTSKDPNWNLYEKADINNDGVIDIADLAALAILIIG
ncbi:GH32 C-terminal domain-containing protein [Paenibacillus silvestris]|nr:GH32 C-terminal domain-containing protein [Paenibacillus silvestris]